jgi:uncharacterized membrane protein YdjX (TVP38/TMEM64 family)
MENRKHKARIAAQAVALAGFAAAVVFLTIKYGPVITRLFAEPERTRQYLLSYGLAAPLIYILIHMVQVIIAFIPGELIQFAGGYVFGTALGSLYSLIGVGLGTVVAFLIVRAAGLSLVKAVVPAKEFERFEFLINGRKSEVMIFVLFLIPGIPKDFLTYIAGLTPIKALKFLLLSTLARFPGLLGSAYIGANLQKRHYSKAIVVLAAAVVLFVVGVIFRDRIIKLVGRLKGGSKGPDTSP